MLHKILKITRKTLTTGYSRGSIFWVIKIIYRFLIDVLEIINSYIRNKRK